MIPPPAPDQSDHRGKTRNVQESKSCWAIFGTLTFGFRPPPPPRPPYAGFHRWQLKNGTSETDFPYILTIRKDQISYVKHVLAFLYVFLTPFGCLQGVGGLRVIS